MSKEKKKKTTSLGYSGNVTIKVLHGKKVVKVQKLHNKGMSSLFTFIEHCLGNNYFEDEAPRFLRTFYCENELSDDNLSANLTLENEISDIVAYSSITYPSTGGVEFTFLVPSSIISSTGGETKINVLALYSQESFSDMTSPLAYLQLEEEDEFSVTNGANLVVLWNLSVDNK